MKLVDKLENFLENAVEPKYSQFDGDPQFQEILKKTDKLCSPFLEELKDWLEKNPERETENQEV